MNKQYTLFHPDIGHPAGRSKKLVEELIELWRDGEDEGACEIAAIAELLTDDGALPYISCHPVEGGAVNRLAVEFGAFLSEMPSSLPSFVGRVIRDMGWKSPHFFVAGLGSATGAIYSALVEAGVAGGEVITTSLNYVGVPNAIVLAGATPQFVDIDEKSWCMDPNSLKKAITKKTKAIVLTHFNRFVDLEPFYDILSERGVDIPIIQDASLAVGSTCAGMRPGVINIGAKGATVISLATSKTITGLGGAVIVANDNSLIERIVTIAYQGMSFKEGGVLDAFGSNFKMNELNAVISMEQLKRRNDIFRRRREIKTLYDKALEPLVKKKVVEIQDVGDEAVVTHYGITLPERTLTATRMFEKHRVMIGMWHVHHLQRIYREKFGKPRNSLAETEKLAEKIGFLPFHTHLSDEDVELICRALTEELGS